MRKFILYKCKICFLTSVILVKKEIFSRGNFASLDIRKSAGVKEMEILER